MSSARYRKIYPAIWNDEGFVGLTPSEKLIALYILCGEQTNRIGIFRFSPAAAAEATGNPPETFREGFARVLETLHWRFDDRCRVVYIPTWWRWNQPENPNVLKGNLSDLDELPKSLLVQEFAQNTEHLSPNLVETFRKRLGERYPKPSPNQEQEQEQEYIYPRGDENPARGAADEPPADGASGHPDGGESLVTDDERVAARSAMDRWSTAERRHPLDPIRDEYRPVDAMLGALAQEPPVARTDGAVPQHRLVPLAVDILIKRGTPFKHVRYALGAVRSELAEWAAKGPPVNRKSTHPNRPGIAKPKREEHPDDCRLSD